MLCDGRVHFYRKRWYHRCTCGGAFTTTPLRTAFTITGCGGGCLNLIAADCKQDLEIKQTCRCFLSAVSKHRGFPICAESNTGVALQGP